MTGYLYDWNMLPIGQLLWEKELMSYKKYPPLQAPETYNLDGILEQIKKPGRRATEAICLGRSDDERDQADAQRGVRARQVKR